MKLTLNTHEAAGILMDDDCANWSPDGAVALIRYLEDLEAYTGEEMELDRVALRCGFSEYDSAADFAESYWATVGDRDRECDIDRELDSVGEIEDKILDFVRERAVVVPFESGVIIQEF
tara:strand:+ start:501 stop:857 length:357 start_codon:yes stop_codon:yes gene_type:complete